MISYRALAHNVQQRLGIRRLEEVLETISVVVRAVAHELTGAEAGLLKRNVAGELHQVVVDGRPVGAHQSRRIITTVSQLLEKDFEEAKRRTLAVLQEIRAGVSPWDEIEFIELLDRLSAEIVGIPFAAQAV